MFEPVAKCMHCGVPLDVRAHDSSESPTCLDENMFILGVHDYDLEFPNGVE